MSAYQSGSWPDARSTRPSSLTNIRRPRVTGRIGVCTVCNVAADSRGLTSRCSSSLVSPPSSLSRGVSGWFGGGIRAVLKRAMPRAWQLRELPTRALAVVLSVELLAVLVPWTNSASIAPADFGKAVFLCLLSIAYSQFSATWEQIRVLLVKQRDPLMCPNLLACWTFSASVLLPMRLAVGVVIVTALVDWRARNIADKAARSAEPALDDKASGRAKLYRYVYSTASVALAVEAASAASRSGLPFAVGLATSAAVYVVIGMVLVMIAILADGQPPARLRIFAKPSTHAIEFYTVSIGILVVLDNSLPGSFHYAWVSLPAAMWIQRHYSRLSLTTSNSPEEAHTVTGAGQAAIAEPEVAAMAERVWLHVARNLTQACTMSSVLRFSSADRVVLRAIQNAQGGCDVIGEYAGGLAMFMTDCPPQNAAALAARIRDSAMTAGLFVKIGVATSPRDGQTIDDLLVIAEAEMVTAGVEVRSDQT